jgi:hypothetical protein
VSGAAAGGTVAVSVLWSGPCGAVLGVPKVPRLTSEDEPGRHEAPLGMAVHTTTLDLGLPPSTQRVVLGVVAALPPAASRPVGCPIVRRAPATVDQGGAAGLSAHLLGVQHQSDMHTRVSRYNTNAKIMPTIRPMIASTVCSVRRRRLRLPWL